MRTRLELPVTLRLAPWLASRGRVLELPSRVVEVQLGSERQRVEARTLAAYHDVLLLKIEGIGFKDLLPLTALTTLARVSPRRLVHLDGGTGGTVYRYVRVDRDFAVAVADQQLTLPALPLRLDLSPPEKERPAPQTA